MAAYSPEKEMSVEVPVALLLSPPPPPQAITGKTRRTRTSARIIFMWHLSKEKMDGTRYSYHLKRSDASLFLRVGCPPLPGSSGVG